MSKKITKKEESRTSNLKEMLEPTTPKKPTKFDNCLELIRSVALFTSVTRILAMVAVIILISTNKDILYGILLINPEQEAFVKDIPKLFTLLANGLLLTTIVINIVGILAYALLNPHLLSLFATSLFLELALLMYIGIVSSNRDLNNRRWISFYKNYKVSLPARHSVNVMQNTFQCCGTAYYKFEDLPLLPRSCCPEESLYEEWICLEQFKYSKLCPSTSNNIYTVLREANFLSYLPFILPILIILTVGMGIVSFYVAYRIIKKEDDE